MWVAVFIFLLVRSTISLNFDVSSEIINKQGLPRSGVKTFDFKNLGPDPQLVEETFNIKSRGFGTVERKLLLDIKARVDSLSPKCKVTASECPNGWVPFENSCYLVIDIPSLKWSDARRTCQNLGGDLAVVKASVENNFIFELMKKQKTVTYLGVWLGLYRKADDKFYWVDDTPAEAGQYSAWAGGEANHVTGSCAHMYGNGNQQGKWNDVVCDLNQQVLSYSPVVLCQKKAD